MTYGQLPPHSQRKSHSRSCWGDWSHRHQSHCRHRLHSHRCLHRRHQSPHSLHLSHRHHHLHCCPHHYSRCHLHHRRCHLHHPCHPFPCRCGASH
ncbi:unnamed protein product [Closterium sp. NIES-54]